MDDWQDVLSGGEKQVITLLILKKKRLANGKGSSITNRSWLLYMCPHYHYMCSQSYFIKKIKNKKTAAGNGEALLSRTAVRDTRRVYLCCQRRRRGHDVSTSKP